MSCSNNEAKIPANSDTTKVTSTTQTTFTTRGNNDENSTTKEQSTSSTVEGKVPTTKSQRSAKKSSRPTTSTGRSRPSVFHSYREPSSYKCYYECGSTKTRFTPSKKILDSLLHSQFPFPVQSREKQPSRPTLLTEGSGQSETRKPTQEDFDDIFYFPRRTISEEVVNLWKSQLSSRTENLTSSNNQPSTSSTQGRNQSESDVTFQGQSQKNLFDFTTLPKYTFPQEMLGSLFQSMNNPSMKKDTAKTTIGVRNWHLLHTDIPDENSSMSTSHIRIRWPISSRTQSAISTKNVNNCERKGSRFKFGDSKSTSFDRKLSSSKVSKTLIDDCERNNRRSKTGITNTDVVLEMGSRCGVAKKSKYRNNKNNASEPIHLPKSLNNKIFSRGALLDQRRVEDAIETIQIEDEENLHRLDQTPSCRICHDDIDEPLISPCRCKGTIAHVHHTCLSTWLSQDNTRSFICELCQYPYPVVEARQYTMLQSIPIWLQNPDNRERFFSFLYVIGFITIINLVVYIVAVMVVRYTALSNAPDWFVTCMFLFLVFLYVWNVVQCFKDTIYDHWYRWWKTKMQVCLDMEAMVQKARFDNTQEHYSSRYSIDSCNYNI